MIQRSFDNIARCYASLEKLVFGNRLQKARTFGLIQTNRPIKQCLLIGDGNGSFAIEVLRKHPQCQITSIDISPQMLATSIRRIEKELGAQIQNFHPIIGDATSIEFEAGTYDFIGLHFVLDCFDTSTANRIIYAASSALKPRGILSYADFEIPNRQPKRFFAKVFIRLLYLLFKGTTGLQTQSLPALSWPKYVTIEHEKRTLGGLLISKKFAKPLAY